MTKIEIDDGKSKTAKAAKVAAKKATKKALKVSASKASGSKASSIKVSSPKKRIAVQSASDQPATKTATKPTVKKSTAPTKKISVEKVSEKTPEKKPAPVEKKSRKIAINAVSSSATHSTVQKSTTLSRRYVKKPTAVVTKKPVISDRALKSVARAVETAEGASQAAQTPKASKAPKAPQVVSQAPKVSKVLQAAQQTSKTSTTPEFKKSETLKTVPTTMEHQFRKKKRGRRLFFALVCSAATVGALVAFVNINMPDISVRVAAMQTGIEATYPTFIPRNYSLANVVSDKDGIVTMYFDGPDGASFSLSEEKSTWDSTALLNNFVKKNYPSDYTTLREQGITIYVRGENASWVNGGLLYKIEATGKNLTKEQIRNIATSL